MENSPQCQMATQTNDIAPVAPALPNTSTKICSTGLPNSVLTVRSKSWIEKR